MEIYNLQQQNKRYREALIQIVNIDGYFTGSEFDVDRAYELIDLAARKALEEF